MTETWGIQVDIFDPDIWSGKTFPELSVQTAARTSEPSSRKPQRSQNPTPLFLDLRGGRNGDQPGVLWETAGPWHGEYMTRNTGEYPSDERGSRLSQILEATPHPKYCLSARACQGILNRAERRGKKLPEMLREALTAQASGATSTTSKSRETSEQLSPQRAGGVALPADKCYPSVNAQVAKGGEKVSS